MLESLHEINFTSVRKHTDVGCAISRLFIRDSVSSCRRDPSSLDGERKSRPYHHRSVFPGRATLHTQVFMGSLHGSIYSTLPRTSKRMDAHFSSRFDSDN